MFVLTRISDVIPVAPSLFDEDYEKVLIEEIDRKFANKVIADVGLCISVYDFVHVGEAFIYPSDGSSHTQVEFRMIVFRPFVGEVLKGRIVSCNEDQIRVSMDFVQDIIIPSYAMQTPSYFDASERLWVWKYQESQESFFLDLGEEIRFRVTSINFTRVTKTAHGIQATTTEASTKPAANAVDSTSKANDMRQGLQRGRSASVDLSETDPAPSAMHIVVVEVRPMPQDAAARLDPDSLLLSTSVSALPDVVCSSIRLSAAPEASTSMPSALQQQMQRRREHHMAAHKLFTDQVQSISERMEAQLLQCSDAIKTSLQALDASLAKSYASLQSEPHLLALGRAALDQEWLVLEATCTSRTSALTAFDQELQQLEQARVELVRTQLRKLTMELMETAFMLPGEVERVIEGEAFELNTVVIANTMAYADLIARMQVADLDVFANARRVWEHAEREWRRLQHHAAITRFQATLASSEFTAPPAREALRQQLETLQDEMHHKQRMPLLQSLLDAGSTLTSKQAMQVLDQLKTLQREEEAQQQHVFDQLRNAHDQASRDAQQRIDALRLELHAIGALAAEPEIVSTRDQLRVYIQDPAMESFFRSAGGLKRELEEIADRLDPTALVSAGHVDALKIRVNVLHSALPLKSVLEQQGREADRRALLATLDKMRQASSDQLTESLLPLLPVQLANMSALDGMDDSYHAAIADCQAQLASLMATPAPDEAADPSETSQATDQVQVVDPRSIDIHAIRKVQRRVMMLVSATGLSPRMQSLLQQLAEQLAIQVQANTAVDQVLAQDCAPITAQRQQESRAFLEQIARHLEIQNMRLHEQSERLAVFFVQLTSAMEQSQDRVRVLDLTLLDLADTLDDLDQARVTELERSFLANCAVLRHAPSDHVLVEQRGLALDALQQLEAAYRLLHRQSHIASEQHVRAMQQQQQLSLRHIAAMVGLVPRGANASTNELDATKDADLPQWISLEHIAMEMQRQDDQRNGVADKPLASSEAAKSPAQQPQPTTTDAGAASHSVSTQPLTVKLSSGSELTELWSIPALLDRIMAPPQADDEPVEAQSELEPPRETEAQPTATHISPQDVNATTDAIAEADAARSSETSAPRVLSDLEISLTFQHDMVATTRMLVVSTVDQRMVDHVHRAEQQQADRNAAMDERLEERLRLHWPRTGRLEVQLVHPRRSELTTHRERLARCISAMRSKDAAQQQAILQQRDAAAAAIESARMQQLVLQTQLPMQQTLAALQGLDAKAKKLISTFRAASDSSLQALRDRMQDDAAQLHSMAQDFVRQCHALGFVDLSSAEQSGGGGEYHPEEVESVQTALVDLQAQLQAQAQARDAWLSELEQQQSNVFDSATEFKTRFQTCLQRLSMEEGLGPKYGLPRRAAQEQFRSETTRLQQAAQAIDQLLAELQTLVVDTPPPATNSTAEDSTQDAAMVRILHLLLRLRDRVYHLGQAFGLIKNASQLEPKAILSTDCSRLALERALDDDDRMQRPHFLKLVEQIATQCRDATRKLFADDGQPENAHATAALDAYLADQRAKAQTVIEQHEGSFRQSIERFAELLVAGATRVLELWLARHRVILSTQTTSLAAAWAQEDARWQVEKEQHVRALRPELCTRNDQAPLDALCQKEGDRSARVQTRLREVRLQVVQVLRATSQDAEMELLALSRTLLTILDSTVLSVDDLQTASGDAMAKSERKSLKRLRKLARREEQGDPREVARSDADLKRIAQLGEVARYPLRAWSGIPAFGLQQHYWTEMIQALLDQDKAMQAESDAALAATLGSQSTDASHAQDGSQVALLTHAHRSVVQQRDAEYAQYCEHCRAKSTEVLQAIQERLQDEAKWIECWEQNITRVRAAPQSTVATAAAAAATGTGTGTGTPR